MLFNSSRIEMQLYVERTFLKVKEIEVHPLNMALKICKQKLYILYSFTSPLSIKNVKVLSGPLKLLSPEKVILIYPRSHIYIYSFFLIGTSTF